MNATAALPVVGVAISAVSPSAVTGYLRMLLTHGAPSALGPPPRPSRLARLSLAYDSGHSAFSVARITTSHLCACQQTRKSLLRDFARPRTLRHRPAAQKTRAHATRAGGLITVMPVHSPRALRRD
jgi:hypothetical protein